MQWAGVYRILEENTRRDSAFGNELDQTTRGVDPRVPNNILIAYLPATDACEAPKPVHLFGRASGLRTPQLLTSPLAEHRHIHRPSYI